jgi:hypothetical protein
VRMSCAASEAEYTNAVTMIATNLDVIPSEPFATDSGKRFF